MGGSKFGSVLLRTDHGQVTRWGASAPHFFVCCGLALFPRGRRLGTFADANRPRPRVSAPRLSRDELRPAARCPRRWRLGTLSVVAGARTFLQAAAAVEIGPRRENIGFFHLQLGPFALRLAPRSIYLPIGKNSILNLSKSASVLAPNRTVS
jgi:hypothetical protein